MTGRSPIVSYTVEPGGLGGAALFIQLFQVAFARIPLTHAIVTSASVVMLSVVHLAPRS